MTIEQEFDLLHMEHNCLDIRSGENNCFEEEPEEAEDMYSEVELG